MTTPVAGGLAALPEGVRVDVRPEILERWSVAGARPAAVVLPRSVEEVATVMARAAEEGWGVVPAGAGTWLDGGGAPDRVDLVVSTLELDGIEEYEPDDLTITAGAGASLSRLREVTETHGQWLAQDPPGAPDSTLGAVVATGLPGALVAGFGRPRDQLLGLTIVTGDGRIVRPGGRVVKNVAGFDLVRGLAGSWGTLGVIAGATFRVHPRPARDWTLVFRASGVGALAARARAMAGAPVVPAALELVEPEPGDPGDAALLVRLLGSEPEVAGALELLPGAHEADGRLEGGESAAIHRRIAGSAVGSALSLRLSLLPARLDELLELGGAIAARGRRHGRSAFAAAHVTRGVLRLEVGGGSGDAVFGDGWVGALNDLRRSLEGRGGSLDVVRGPRDLVAAVGVSGGAGRAARLVAGLKRAFDPAGVLAPGRGHLGRDE